MNQPWDNPLTIPADIVELVLIDLFNDNDDEEDERPPEDEHPSSSGKESLGGRLLSVFVKGLRRSSRSGRREDD